MEDDRLLIHHSSLRTHHYFFRRRLAAADAVWNARAVEGVAGEFEGGKFFQAPADSAYAVEVAEVILCHRARPLLRLGEERRRFDAEQFSQVAARFREYLFFVERE